jgi:eukaryotic-like serine/threonine-protein kinase
MTGPLVLPQDVEIIPVTALSASVRSQIGGADDDYAVTRPLSRFPSKVIDSQAAAWLRQFEEPTTLVQALLRHSAAVDRKPQEVLEDIYPFLESCLRAKLLVEPGVESQTIQPSFASGTVVEGRRIEECVQVLADSELYRVSNQNRLAALKITRPEASPEVKQSLAREAKIQDRLAGRVAPRLFASGETEDGRAYVISEWIDGELCTARAAILRMSSRDPLSPAMLSLCGNILDAYAALHRLGVTHSDVHSGNILIARDGEVRIVDFGLSRMDCGDESLALSLRGGVGFYFEPEYARAALAHSVIPLATFASEQYSIGVLIYQLVTGRHYLDFSLEKEQLLRQIVEEPPVSLAARGLPGAAALDRVLLRALSKDPSARFSDVTSMAATYWQEMLGADSPNNSGKVDSNVGDAPLPETQEREDWLNSFLDSLRDREEAAPLSAAACSITSRPLGLAGAAYRLFRVACIREDTNLLAVAERWLDRVESDLASADVPSFDGSGLEWCESPFGVAWLRALMAHSCWDFYRRSWATEHFLQICSAMLENGNPSDNSSALLATSLLLDAFRWDASANHQALIELGNRLLRRLWDELGAAPPLAAPNDLISFALAANRTKYLYATLQWMRAAGAVAPAQLGARLDELAKRVIAEGTCPCSLSDMQPLNPVWSDGSSALVFLGTLASRVLRDPRWLRFAEAAGRRDFVGSRSGGFCLQGLIGEAYSQLSLYKHTADRCWLERAYEIANAAVRLAKHANNVRVTQAFRWREEDLGLATLVADLAQPRCSAMPFIEEEQWPCPAS